MPPDRYELETLPRICAGLDLLLADGTRFDDEDLRMFVRTAIRIQRPLFTGLAHEGTITLNEAQVRMVEAALWRESLASMTQRARQSSMESTPSHITVSRNVATCKLCSGRYLLSARGPAREEDLRAFTVLHQH